MASKTSNKIDNNVCKAVSNKSQRIRKTNLVSEIVIPLHNVYKTLDIDFHSESSNEHDDKSTLKETETQRNTNLIKKNIQRNITNRKKRERCITERYIKKPVENSKKENCSRKS